METVLKDREAMVALYAPYCEGGDQPQLLDQALDKLVTTRLNGSRRLKPDGSHLFELTWQPGESPQEPSHCQLSFPEVPAVSYSFSVPTAQLVLWLMQTLESQASPSQQSPARALPTPDTVPAARPPALLFPGPPLPAPGLGLPPPGLPGLAMPPPPLPFGTPLQPASLAAKGAVQAEGPADLPESFWRWLLVGDIPSV